MSFVGFVIGGYKSFDAAHLWVLRTRQVDLMWPALETDSPHCGISCFIVFVKLKIPHCPFANLPEARSGRWGFGFTAGKMNIVAG
jgi:hypothetical protein